MIREVRAMRGPTYPRKNISKRDYSELEVPDEDYFLCELYSVSSSVWV